MYLNNQLAKGEAAMLEATQLGTIDISPVGAAPIGGIFEPGFLPLSLPFLWPSRQHVWKAMDGPVGAELSEAHGGEGPQGAVLRRRLGLPQRDVEQAADQRRPPT